MEESALQQQTNEEIKAEQIKAFHADIAVHIVVGTVVFSLVVLACHSFVPAWKYLPALALVYVSTAVRLYHVRRYQRSPELKSPAQWGKFQTIYSALAGAAWGFGFVQMLPLVPPEYQLLILSVSTVACASAVAESFTFAWPSRVFTLGVLLPQMVWLTTTGVMLHFILLVMLLMFVPMVLWQGHKRNRIFAHAVELRVQKKQLVDELLQQRDLVEQASRDKMRFLASASHDLRQPLAALVLFLDLLETDEQLSNQSRNMVLRAHQAANSLSGLLMTLLDISKLDAAIVKPKRSVFAVQMLLKELENEFTPLAQEKNLQLCFAFSSALIDSDPVLLGQILRNLITNALRYTDKGHVLVGCRHHHDKLSIEVHDTGIGIPADQHEAIFREFYQLGNSERDRQKGLGLGLAIVKRTAQLLGHDIGLNSQPGKGSCFTVTVPLAQGFSKAGEQPYQEADEPVKLDVRNQRIAIIENEEDIRIALQTMVRSWGCEAIAAASIDAMTEMLDRDQRPPTAVISDFSLSDFSNGIDAITALRLRFGADLPALLITGDTTKETYLAAQEASLLLLYKPVTAETLRGALAGILRPA